MEINNYIDNIVFYVVSAISALAGTSLGIGAICKWIKNRIVQSVEKLTSGKNDYDKEVNKLALAAVRIDATGEKLIAVGTTLDSFGKELVQMRRESTENIDKINAISQVLSIMVQQNEFMVANGTAKQCIELLNEAQASAVLDRVVNNE